MEFFLNVPSSIYFQTPHFLMISHKESEAEKTIRQLGLSNNVRQMMADIRYSVNEDQGKSFFPGALLLLEKFKIYKRHDTTIIEKIQTLPSRRSVGLHTMSLVLCGCYN